MYRGCGDRNSDVSPLGPSSILSLSLSFSLSLFMYIYISPPSLSLLRFLPVSFLSISRRSPLFFSPTVFLLLVVRSPPSISFLVSRPVSLDRRFTLFVRRRRRTGRCAARLSLGTFPILSLSEPHPLTLASSRTRESISTLPPARVK